MRSNRTAWIVGGWLLTVAVSRGNEFSASRPPAEPAIAPPASFRIGDDSLLMPGNRPFDGNLMPMTRAALFEPATETAGPLVVEPVWFGEPSGYDADDKARISDLEKRLATMESQMQASPRAAAAAQVAAIPTPAFPRIKLGGFFQVETGDYSQTANSVATLGRLQNGTGFRRARLQVYGQLSEFTNYIVEMDFAAAGRPSIYDVWVEQTNLPILGSVRVGQYRQPFSLDALTSARQLQFMERSLPFQAFVPFRRVGVMAYRQSEDTRTNIFASVFETGGFNNNAFGDDRYGTKVGNQGGYSFSTRMTHLFYYDEASNGRYLLHGGASYDFSDLAGSPNNQKFYQATAIPEFFVGYPDGITSTSGTLVAASSTVNAGTPRFVSTGSYQANSFNIVGGEILGQWGPFHAQAEYMATSVNTPNADTVFYDGAYAQAGWILTGESRTYNKLNGALDRLLPFNDFFSLRNRGIRGWGAWELATRWSYVDLNNPTGLSYLSSTAQSVAPTHTNPGTSGRLTDFTTGLNWYVNAYTRLQFNWINAQLHNQTKGFSNTQIYALMLQAEF